MLPICPFGSSQAFSCATPAPVPTALHLKNGGGRWTAQHPPASETSPQPTSRQPEMSTRLQRGPRESPAFCGNLASVLHPRPLPSACRHPQFPPPVLYQEDGLSTVRPQWSSLIFISSQSPKYQQGIQVYLDRQQHLRNIFSYKKKKKL